MAKKYFSGLTLVELLIVLAILALLAGIILVAFSSQIFKANDAKRKGDIDRIKIAVEEYEKDHNCNPQNVDCKPGTSLQPYLDKIPCDPITGASYVYVPENTSCPTWYRIYSILQNTKDSSVTAGVGPMGAFNYMQGGGYAQNLATPSPTPSGVSSSTSPTLPSSGFYGCKSGVCSPILWDPKRPGPECDPNWQDPACQTQCVDGQGKPINECESWD